MRLAHYEHQIHRRHGWRRLRALVRYRAALAREQHRQARH